MSLIFSLFPNSHIVFLTADYTIIIRAILSECIQRMSGDKRIILYRAQLYTRR